MSYFTMQEFNISNSVIPRDINFKIREYHIKPLDKVREKFGKPVRISQRSGWRPLWWEKSMGRSGKSEHVFRGKGASDVTCDNFSKNKDDLLDLLMYKTEYKRIADYGTFFHCDYKGSKRILFDRNWRRLLEF